MGGPVFIHDCIVALSPKERAWRPEWDGFACAYTGVVLDHGGPWGVAFDERVPGKVGSTVVSSEWARRMKRGLSEGELWAVVRRHLRTGGPFRRGAVSFDWWTERAPPPRPGTFMDVTP